MKIETERLILRPMQLSDAKSVAENISDLEVTKWLLVVPYPYSVKDAKEFIKRTQKKWKVANINDYSFGIELKEEKRVIGGIGLREVDTFQGTGDVGYWLGKKYHGKGYGSEALRAVIDLAFKKLKLRRLEAGVFKENPSSGKLLEKFGFKIEGFKPQSRRCKADGKIKDEYLYGLLRKI